MSEREALIESLRSTVLSANAELERRTEEMQETIEAREALIRELVVGLEWALNHSDAVTLCEHNKLHTACWTRAVSALAKAKEFSRYPTRRRRIAPLPTEWHPR